MTQRGRLEAIWLKRVRRGPMDPVDEAQLVEERGLAGNANQGGRRQVTIIEAEAWEHMLAELGASLPPSTRRANLMLRGITLARTRGSLLRIGDCVLEIAGETRPCNLMEESLPGLRHAMSPHWRGGVFARVLRGGNIHVGGPVELTGPNVELFEA
jgi:MOSC domain-containing protein YiiM